MDNANNLISSEGAFNQTYQDFLLMADVMMTGTELGWMIGEGQPHKCGCPSYWIGPNADGTAHIIGCVNCNTPRMIFTNN